MRGATIALLTFCGGCALARDARAERPTVQQESERDPKHILVPGDGETRLKRSHWDDYARAFFGTPVRRGDLLHPDETATARVVCADLTVKSIPGGRISGVPCPDAESPVLVSGRSLLSPTRGLGPPGIPVVVSPRRTKVLDPRPLLQWKPVGGATAHTVRLIGMDTPFAWSAVLESTHELLYPADAPPLERGKSYKLTVEAGGRSSAELRTPDLGFTVLSADEARTVQREEERVRSLNLPASTTKYVVAQLYASSGLAAEATLALTRLSEELEASAIHLTLGELYLDAGLIRLAEDHYLKAREISEDTRDVEGEAQSRIRLGRIYDELLGNQEAAEKSLLRAKELFAQLGDRETVLSIEERLLRESRPKR